MPKENTPSYISWKHMMQRCYNPNNVAYKDYGGRGIRVYRRWWKFKNFYKDMGERPKGMSLERIDNSKGYRPSNCKWATPQEQAHNTKGKGYCWDKTNQNWKSYITVNYKQITLGNFGTPEEARQAHLDAKEKYHTRQGAL